MAKKKNSSLTYLQKPIPAISRKSSLSKKTWSGLNLRQTVDSGMLSEAVNISMEKYPYLTPSRDIDTVLSGYTKPLGLFGFDDFLIIVYVSNGVVHIDKIKRIAGQYKVTGFGESSSDDLASQRCIVQFNVFNDNDTVTDGSYDRKLIIFPDKLSVSCDDDEFKLEAFETVDNAVPSLKYACVHLSRLFGVDDGRIYASAFNDYSNWNVDTAEEHNESNAWFSASQSNSKADGVFTGITAFQNHVVCFKKDFMHEIYNTKNPFRIQDIYAEGAVDNRTICDVDGRLIFCSEDGVKIYTGSNPKIISYALGIDKFYSPVAGTDGRCYYLYCKDNQEGGNHRLFVYDTYCDAWTERDTDDRIISFAKCDEHIFALDASGNVKILDGGTYASVWSLCTDLMTASSLDLKHIDKLSLSCNIADGASMQIYIEDSQGNGNLIWDSDGRKGYTVARVKIRGTAYDGFKIKVRGTGFVEIMSMELLIKSGGELYV